MCCNKFNICYDSFVKNGTSTGDKIDEFLTVTLRDLVTRSYTFLSIKSETLIFTVEYLG